MKLKKQLVMLPTDKKAMRPLIVNPSIGRNGKMEIPKHKHNYSAGVYQALGYETFHLHILSDEEIKEGDWCYDKVLNIVFQTDKNTDFEYVNKTDSVLKIIATTDKSLEIVSKGINPVYQSLPQIPQSFIEHFVSEHKEDNIITEVMVEYEEVIINQSRINLPNIIEKRLKINSENTINIEPIKYSWNREEVEDLLHSLNRDKPGNFDCSSWIEENL